MKTEKCFVVGFSKDDKENFCWFVGHPKINKGNTVPVNRGEIEAVLTKLRRQVMKEEK